MTRIAEGGIRDASVPAAATTPAAKRLSYPMAVISGMAIRANTADVATEAPDTAANPAVANTVDTARPPGTHPTHLLAASKSALVQTGVVGEVADQYEGRDERKGLGRYLGVGNLARRLHGNRERPGKLLGVVAALVPEDPDKANHSGDGCGKGHPYAEDHENQQEP